MTKLVVAGVFLVAVVQLFAVIKLERHLVIAVTGAVLAGVLVAVRWRLTHHHAETLEDAATDDVGAALRRWLARTETLISWSESTRADWDRRLRPMLARQFELAAGQRKAKDPSAFDATGRMLFGDELWQWVDPENISRTGGQEPGPGRQALNDILQRLERI
ncbi:MAG: hypothetical protein U1D00_06040 [Mycobacterium sp.]|nr:hypothetical protein [Mycobacterium sp.]